MTRARAASGAGAWTCRIARTSPKWLSAARNEALTRRGPASGRPSYASQGVACALNPAAVAQAVEADVHEPAQDVCVPGVEEVGVGRVDAARREREVVVAGDRVAVDEADRRHRTPGGRPGSACLVGYVRWLLWSALSRLVPSQQLGKVTWSRSPWPRPLGQAGGVDDGRRRLRPAVPVRDSHAPAARSPSSRRRSS